MPRTCQSSLHPCWTLLYWRRRLNQSAGTFENHLHVRLHWRLMFPYAKKNILQRSQASLCVAILTHTVATVLRISRSTCFSTCSFNIFMHLIIASIDAKWLVIKAQRQSSGPLQYRQIMQVFEMWIRESYIEHNRIYDYRMQQVKKTKCSGKQTLQTPWLQEYLPLVVPFIQSQHLPQKEPTRHKSWKPMEKWSRWQTFHDFPSFPAIDSKIQLFRLYGCREL